MSTEQMTQSTANAAEQPQSQQAQPTQETQTAQATEQAAPEQKEAPAKEAVKPEPNFTDEPAQDEAKADKADEGEAKEGEEKAATDEVQPFALEQLALPEGFVVDSELGQGFTEVMNKLELSKDKAQALFDFYADNVLGKMAEAHIIEGNNFMAQTKSDPELSGVNEAEARQMTVKALNLLDADTRKMLDERNLLKHAGTLKFLKTVGKMMSSDAMVTSSSGASEAPKSNAEVLFAPERIIK